MHKKIFYCVPFFSFLFFSACGMQQCTHHTKSSTLSDIHKCMHTKKKDKIPFWYYLAQKDFGSDSQGKRDTILNTIFQIKGSRGRVRVMFCTAYFIYKTIFCRRKMSQVD